MVEVFDALDRGNYKKIFELAENSPIEDELEINLIKIWIYLDFYAELDLVVNLIDEMLSKEYISERNQVLLLFVKSSKSLFVAKNLVDAKNLISMARKSFDQLSANKKVELRRFNIYFPIYEFTIGVLEGEVEKSIKLCNEVLELCKINDYGINVEGVKILVKNDLAVLYRNIGQIDKSNQLFTENLIHCESSGNIYGQVIALRGLVTNEILIGDLETALNHFKKIFELADLINNNKIKFEVLFYLGEIYYHKNQITESLKVFEEYLSHINKDIIIFSITPIVFFNLIKLNIEINEIDKAKQYLLKLDEVRKVNPDFNLDILYKLSEILLLKNSLRFKDKVLAQEMLKEIVQNTDVNLNMKLTSLIYLCELQLQEIELLGDETLFQDILSLLSRIREISLEFHYQPFIIESELLQSKLALIEGKIDTAYSFLENAEKLALEKNLTRYLNKISAQKKHLNDNLAKWKELKNNSKPSIKEKIELAQLRDYIDEALKLKEFSNM